LLLADLGPQTFFGTRQRLKSLAIAELTTLLLWRAYDDGDRVGALLRTATGLEALRPRKTQQSVLRIQNQLREGCEALAERYGARPGAAERPAPDSVEGLNAALQELQKVVRPGTTVIVVSDFADGLDPFPTVLKQLGRLGRQAQVHGILISDPFERAAPPAGRYPLSDGRRRQTLDLAGREASARWTERYQARRDGLAAQLQSQEGLLLECSTDGDYLQDLGRWLR
jgi:uncharacterized protein (DUF58 family)